MRTGRKAASRIAGCGRDAVECEFAWAHGGAFAKHHELDEADEDGHGRATSTTTMLTMPPEPRMFQRKAIRVHGEGRQYADEPCEHAGADDGAGREYGGKDIGDGLPRRFSQGGERERPAQADQGDGAADHRRASSVGMAGVAVVSGMGWTGWTEVGAWAWACPPSSHARWAAS